MPMNKPLVSAVLVVCNVDRFLAEAIEGILDQTFRDFEFIIVDFGSTDRSKEIITGYAAKDSRIKFHEITNCELAQARNVACFLAQGQYIAIVDADDVSLAGRLESEVEFMELNPSVALLGGACEWIDATGKTMANPVLPPAVSLRPPTTNREIQAVLPQYNIFWQPSVLIRREVFASVGGYRPIFVQSEDYDLWVRIAEGFEVANLDQVVVKYRIHPYQVSLRKRKQQTLCSLAVKCSGGGAKKWPTRSVGSGHRDYTRAARRAGRVPEGPASCSCE